MRPVKLNDFKIDARHIAELEWGTGGTNAMRTNRNGAYYYSCSGHGGYVVDARCLTEAEKAAIAPYASPNHLNVLVAHAPDGDIVYGVDYQNFTCYPKNRRFYVPLSLPREWVKLDVYTFEEDCAWSILEKFTDIATTHALEKVGAATVKEMAEGTFQRWYADKKPAEAPAAQ